MRRQGGVGGGGGGGAEAGRKQGRRAAATAAGTCRGYNDPARRALVTAARVSVTRHLARARVRGGEGVGGVGVGLGFGLAASPNRAAWSHRARAALQGTLHAHARRAAAAGSTAAGSAAAGSGARVCFPLREDGGGQQHGHRPLGGAAALDGRPEHGRAVGRVEGARVACARRSKQVAARARGRGLHVGRRPRPHVHARVVPVSGLGRRSSVSGRPLEGWLVASKGLAALSRRRGSALAHGCGRSGRVVLPLARAAAISTGSAVRLEEV